MIVNEAPNYEAEKLLYQLYHEIAILKGRVDAACPAEMAKCKDQLRPLLKQYKLLEAQVEAIKKARDEPQAEQYTLAMNHLRELQELLAATGHWILIQTAS